MELLTCLNISKVGIKQSISIAKKVNVYLKKNKIKECIISSVNGELKSEYSIDISKKIVEDYYDKVIDSYKNINFNNYSQSIEDTIWKTLELAIVESDLKTELDDTSYKKFTSKVLRKLFLIDGSLEVEYMQLIALKNINVQIPRYLVDLEDTVNFKRYAEKISNRVNALNNDLEDNFSNLTLEFYDYHDNNFEMRLKSQVQRNKKIIISGPSIEEAMYYTALVLSRLLKDNIYIVKNENDWNNLTNINKIDYYSDIILLSEFTNNCLPIENAITIVFIDNDSLIDDDEEVISFQNRKKNQTIEAIKKLDANELTSINEIHTVVNENFNNYQIYKKFIFKSVQKYKKINATENLVKLAMVGSFYTANDISKDEKIISTFLNRNIATYLSKEEIERYIFHHTSHSTIHIMDREHILRSSPEIILRLYEKFEGFSADVLQAYYQNYFQEVPYIQSADKVSNVLKNSVLHTIQILSNNSIDIDRIIDSISDQFTCLQINLIKISVIEKFIYDKPEYVKNTLIQLTQDELDVKFITKPLNYFLSSDYASSLQNTLSKLLYHESYHIDALECILDIINYCIKTENTYEDYSAMISRYYGFYINDYPLNESQKLAQLKTISFKKRLQLLDIIYYKLSNFDTYPIYEIPEKNGFSQVRRDANRGGKDEYFVEIIKLYLEEENNCDFGPLIKSNYLFYMEELCLVDKIENIEFSNNQLILNIREIRDKLCMHYKYKNWRLNEKLVNNYYKLLSLFESKLTNSILKYYYVFTYDDFKSEITANEITINTSMSEIEIEDLENDYLSEIKEYVLSSRSNDIKELLLEVFKIDNLYIKDYDYIIQCLIASEYTFEESLSIFFQLNRNEEIIVVLRKYKDFCINDIYEAYSRFKPIYDNQSNIMDLGYYCQAFNFDCEYIGKQEESLAENLLKYKSLWKVQEPYDLYKLFRKHKLGNKALKLINEYTSEISSSINILDEIKKILLMDDNKEKFQHYTLETTYETATKYYESDECEDAKENIVHITILLAQVIDEFETIANIIFEDIELLALFLRVVYVDDAGETTEKVDNYINFYHILTNIDIPEYYDNLQVWIDKALSSKELNNMRTAFNQFLGDITGRKFKDNTAILFSIQDRKLLTNSKFRRAFVIGYSNSIGVMTGDIDSVPPVFMHRVELVDKLILECKSSSNIQYIELLNDIKKDLNYHIDYLSFSGRN